jgi:hypothetical protein
LPIKIIKGNRIISLEAFAKAKKRDLNAINLLAKDANPAIGKNVQYCQLNERQEK